MIQTADEYRKAKDELRFLESWLQRLQQDHPVPAKGFTKAGIRKMIARLHEELAVYEGSQEVEQSGQPLLQRPRRSLGGDLQPIPMGIGCDGCRLFRRGQVDAGRRESLPRFG